MLLQPFSEQSGSGLGWKIQPCEPVWERSRKAFALTACHLYWQTSQDLQNPMCQVRVHREAPLHGLLSFHVIVILPRLDVSSRLGADPFVGLAYREKRVTVLFQTFFFLNYVNSQLFFFFFQQPRTQKGTQKTGKMFHMKQCDLMAVEYCGGRQHILKVASCNLVYISSLGCATLNRVHGQAGNFRCCKKMRLCVTFPSANNWRLRFQFQNLTCQSYQRLNRQRFQWILKQTQSSSFKTGLAELLEGLSCDGCEKHLPQVGLESHGGGRSYCEWEAMVVAKQISISEAAVQVVAELFGVFWSLEWETARKDLDKHHATNRKSWVFASGPTLK